MGKLSIAEIREKKLADIYTTEEFFIMQNSCTITLTQAATDILMNQSSPDIYVGLTTKGCNGLTYIIEKPTVKNISNSDRFGIKDIVVWLDKKVVSTLEGSVGTLDYVSEKFKQDFIFTTSKETSRCGCGESFSI